ncbi:MAG: class 1 fructose-bisphosphatase [Caldilineaceae bacterium]
MAGKTTGASLAEILGSTGEEERPGRSRAEAGPLRAAHHLPAQRSHGTAGRHGSEEEAEIIHSGALSRGQVCATLRPLNDSSNIDYNISIGTIFAIYRRRSESGPGTLADVLQPGRDLVAAGYIIYGSSTMMVYSAGQGVHGFTLDPNIGEFLLSHPNIRIPEKPKYYSVNQGYERYWSPGVQRFTRWLQGKEEGGPGLSLRYIGSLVADFHRNLLSGGVFYYPADTKDAALPHGKLQLAYEAAPLAFLAAQAGGYASDGAGPILDLTPASLHQRTPLFVGNRGWWRKWRRCWRTNADAGRAERTFPRK